MTKELLKSLNEKQKLLHELLKCSNDAARIHYRRIWLNDLIYQAKSLYNENIIKDNRNEPNIL